jgi:hypothetical protein
MMHAGSIKHIGGSYAVRCLRTYVFSPYRNFNSTDNPLLTLRQEWAYANHVGTITIKSVWMKYHYLILVD